MAFTKKKSLPQTQIGVSERSNIRMKKLVAPYCPIQDNPNKPGYTGDMNCQQEFSNAHGWWEHCESRGHDPYWTTKKTIKKEPIVGEDGVITAYREVLTEKKKLNLVQVPISTRLNNGRGEALSKIRKGRKELSAFGYNDLCEYRNCEKDVKLKSRYGNFCGDRHARLIGADVEAIMLDASKGRKNKQLREIDVDFEGVVVLQAPPDIEGTGF